MGIIIRGRRRDRCRLSSSIIRMCTMGTGGMGVGRCCSMMVRIIMGMCEGVGRGSRGGREVMRVCVGGRGRWWEGVRGRGV